mgnify:CR=1 FL=1
MRHIVYVNKQDGQYSLWVQGLEATCDTLAEAQKVALDTVEFATGKSTTGDQVTLRFKTPVGWRK